MSTLYIWRHSIDFELCKWFSGITQNGRNMVAHATSIKPFNGFSLDQIADKYSHIRAYISQWMVTSDVRWNMTSIKFKWWILLEKVIVSYKCKKGTSNLWIVGWVSFQIAKTKILNIVHFRNKLIIASPGIYNPVLKPMMLNVQHSKSLDKGDIRFAKI